MDLLSVQVLVQQHGGKVTGPRPFAGLACGKSETGLCAGRSLAVPARPRALHPDPAAVLHDQRSGDGQPPAAPPAGTVSGRLGAKEAVEDPLQRFWGDPGTFVAHSYD